MLNRLFSVCKLVIISLLAISLSGCAGNILSGLGFETDTPGFWSVYNRVKSDADAQAMAGKISWVEASIKVRDADRYLAENKDGYDTSWKFDSDDVEYHAYVIAIAEKLDRREISFATFDASRIAKFNEINARRESINLQRQSVKNFGGSSPEAGIVCIGRGELPSQGLGTHCVYDCPSGRVIIKL